MLSVSWAEWVRQALHAARRREPVGDAGKKLDVIRAAVRHEFPTADTEQMLDQMESDYRAAARGALHVAVMEHMVSRRY